MSRSFRARRNRTVNTQDHDQSPDTGFFQKKEDPSFFEVNEPGDQHEQEADAVADKTIQRLSTPKDEQEPATNDGRMKLDKDIQRCPCEDKKEAAPPEVTARIQDRAGKGQPLPQTIKQKMGHAMGADFSNVHVHTDTEAAGMSKELGAQAFTHGSDIYFNSGKYDPSSTRGQHLLAHELTHVVQQGEAPAINKKIQRNVLPAPPQKKTSGSVNMGPGISVSWNGNSIAITGHLEVSGAAATPAIAKQMESTINRMWNQTFADGYSVTCKVDVIYRGENGTEDSSRTQINVVSEAGPSYVKKTWLFGNKYMSYNVAESDNNWTPAHEFGHLIGMPDHYSENSWWDQLWGEKRKTTPDPGWENNIMAKVGSPVESINIKEWLDLYSH